ncbi:MAG TPA: hypothetical protein PKC72_10765 [Chitinophagaceae bacterium]|nr:hypothetical protein [Chitinophagaceae bacterium]
MRKLLFYMIGLMWFASTTAQETNSSFDRSFFSVNAGISVPFLCYGSSDINKNTSGFAGLGFTIDISYVYRFSKHVGAAGMVYYCSNKAGNKDVAVLSSSHRYRFFGVMTGPALLPDFSDRWTLAIAPMAGVARVLTPKLQLQDETLLNENKKTCFAWGGSLALRYHLSGTSFLQLKTDHLNMKPQFKPKAGDAGKGEQHIVVLNVDAGIGWEF